MIGPTAKLFDPRIARRLVTGMRAAPVTITYVDNRGITRSRSERLCALALQVDAAAYQLAGVDVTIRWRTPDGKSRVEIRQPLVSDEAAWEYLTRSAADYLSVSTVRQRVIWLRSRGVEPPEPYAVRLDERGALRLPTRR